MTDTAQPPARVGPPSPDPGEERVVRRAHSRARPARGGKRKGKPRKRHTVGRVLGVTVLVLAMVTGLSMVYLYRHLSGNITELTLDEQLGERPDEVAVSGPQEPLNILVMGDDTREGAGNAIDGEGGGGSDTTIFVHLSADRQRAYGVSIPRDSMVDRPECYSAGRRPIAGSEDDYVMWNAAYSVGGPACTIRQFEQNTGIKIDHYVVVDFNGFKEMVDAIGGVEVCVPEDWDDREHGIYLRAGTRRISGNEALSYVRIRDIGDGSDLSRVKRQQAFIGSMVAQVLSSNTLANPLKVVGFLEAATKSLRVDQGLSDLTSLGQLAYQFRDIGLDKIQFLTVPLTTDPNDPNRVVWTPEADQLWNRLKHDRPLSRDLSEDAISANQVPGASQPPAPGGSGSASPGGEPSGSPATAPSAPQSPVRSPEVEERLEAAGLCA